VKSAALVVLATGVTIAGCASAGLAGCPERYEGQTVTVTGTIVSSGSAFGLSELTTLKDASGNICLLVSRSALGRPGDMITVANQIATTNKAKTPPKYLYPASDPDLGK